MDREQALRRAGEAAAALIQGEVLELPDSCTIVVDPAYPLTEVSAAEAEEPNGRLKVVATSVTDVVVLTQTCDLARTSAAECLCQISPVTTKDERVVHEIARGRHPGWAAVPWHSALSVVDLAQITTIERSVLVEAPSKGRPKTAAERFHFAESVSRHFSRVAVPDSIAEVLRPLLSHLRDRNDRQSPEGSCIRNVQSIRVEGVPSIDADSPDITIIFLLPEAELPTLEHGVELDMDQVDALGARPRPELAEQVFRQADPKARREAWIALAEAWIQPCVVAAERSSEVGELDVLVLNDEEFSFVRSKTAPEVDLSYLSSRP